MPKFNQRKDFNNYNKPKFNNFNKQKKWNTINVKAFRDFDDPTPAYKWLKVTSLTPSHNSLHEIVDKIEDLCVKNKGCIMHYKAYNVLYSNGMLEFYIKMTKSDIDFVIHNIYKIDHYRLKCYKNEDIHVPHEIPSNWIEFIKQTLKNRYSINSVNNEAELNLSNFVEDKMLNENGLILNFSSPRVFECVLNILKQELQELTKLNLSNNGLNNLFKLKSFLGVVNILRLDISNNRLTNISDLNSLENSSIIDLDISGNQFRKSNPLDLKKDVRKILPNLKCLNGMKLEESVVIAGETLKSSKVLPNVIKSSKETEAYSFILNFFSKFDSKSRDELCDFYSSESVLTMSTNGDSLNYYKSVSSNYFYKDSERKTENIKRGKAQILGTFVNFPSTKHIEESLNVDVVDSNELFLILVVTGIFIELPSSKSASYRVREFSRTLIIVQGGIILQEFIHLFPNDSNLYHKYKANVESVREQFDFSKSHKDLENLSSQEIEIVRQFKTFSGMNVPTCLRFLKSFNGLEAASEEFRNLQSQGSIPIEAYRDE